MAAVALQHHCWLQDTIKFFFRGGAYSMADILPQRFGPANLLTDPTAPLLLQPQHHTLELTAGACPPCLPCWNLQLVSREDV